MTKPPFALPTMADVAAARGTTGLKVASTFSGCGGSCLGFEMAGYEVVWASEFVEAARETYAANHPDALLDGRDIRKVQAEEILDAIGMKQGELDVLNGSPPCASFSTSGKREKGWGQVKKYSDTTQRTDDLFFEFARILDGLQPRAFVAENVAGLVRGTALGYFKEIMRALTACGYRVECRVLDAQWLGVPQTRNRAIFMGVRNDIDLAPSYPKPLPYNYTIRDACPWIGRVVHDTSGTFGKGDVTNSPSPAITVGVNSLNSSHFKVNDKGMQVALDREGIAFRSGQQRGTVHSFDEPSPAVMAEGIGGASMRQARLVERVQQQRPESFEGYAIEKEWRKLRRGEVSRKYLNLVRTDADAPSNAITATGGSKGAAGPTHPYEPRKFTIEELRRICAFPDDFVLTGSYNQQWERLGRAVPPRMMYHVAVALRDGVFAKLGRVREGFREAP